MTTTTITPTGGILRKITPQRIASAGMWAAAVWTTWIFIGSLGAIPISWGIGIACIIQAAFTFIESRIWRGDFSAIGLIILGADVLINAGGMWVWLSRIDQSPPWQMFVEAAGAPAILSNPSKLAFSIVVGIVLAYLPEATWRS